MSGLLHLTLLNNASRIGHGRHVMTYTIAGGKSLNLVLSHVDHSSPSTWKPENAVQDMRAEFDGWDPRLAVTL